MELMWALFAASHRETGVPGAIDLLGVTSRAALRRGQRDVNLTLYVQLADLSQGAHQVVVGPYDNPLGVSDILVLPAHFGQFITFFAGPFSVQSGEEPYANRYPVHVERALVGEAVLYVRRS